MDLTNLNKDRKDRRKAAVDLSTMVYGKVPPQAKDLEEMVLGAIMLDRNAIDIAALILTAESFYVESHQRIFRAAMTLNLANQAIDIATVCNQLRTTEELEYAGGPYYVTRLTNSVTSAVGTETHCRIIQQKFIQRELIRISGEIMQEAYEDSADAFELLDYAEEKLLSVGTTNLQGDVVSIENVVPKAMQRIETARMNDSAITGVPSGFPTLDHATRGWQPGLIILAARPSVGKSALALALADAATKNPYKVVPVAIWSLEMDAVQNVLRMLSSNSEIYLHRIQTGRLEDHQVKHLYDIAAQLAKRKIFFDDKPNLTILSLRAKARRLKKKYNIGLIIIDYLQLMSGSGEKGNREQEIARISRGLKLLSKELDIPVIALSQMSRAIESRTGSKRIPQLSDIRESGAIEQDADVVIMLWGPEEDEVKEDASKLKERYARIAKQRDGVLLTVNLEFRTEIQKLIEQNPDKPDLPAGSWIPVPTVAAPRDYTEPSRGHEEELPF
jgi:replicative DNA helicase